jgi:acyl-CoA thioesterase I
MKNVRKITIFGDSIMKGVLLDDTQDRYYTIDNHGVAWMENQYGLEIQNKAMFGCTVTKGSQMLHRTTQRGLDADIVVLEFGGNDCDFAWNEVAEYPEKEHLPKTSMDDFESTYIQMITDLRSQHISPLMMTIPPIDAQRYLNWICHIGGLDKTRILQWLGGDVQIIARYQELYSHALSRIASQTHTQIVDVRSSFLSRKDCSSLICRDGIHPNEKGHVLITEIFSQFASRVLMQVS